MESYVELVFWQCPLGGDDALKLIVHAGNLLMGWDRFGIITMVPLHNRYNRPLVYYQTMTILDQPSMIAARAHIQ